VEQAERFKTQATTLVVERDTLASKAESATKMAAQAAGATLAMSLQHQQLVEQYAKLEGHAKSLLRERNELAEKVGGCHFWASLTLLLAPTGSHDTKSCGHVAPPACTPIPYSKVQTHVLLHPASHMHMPLAVCPLTCCACLQRLPQMQQLEVQQQEYAASREAALKELTDKISSILKQYFGQHISEADAILRMAELGVDIDPAAVRCVWEGGGGGWDGGQTGAWERLGC
jgi:hypothetical protein